MLIQLFIVLVCSLCALSLYIVMVLLIAISRENELPDLKDIEV